MFLVYPHSLNPRWAGTGQANTMAVHANSLGRSQRAQYRSDKDFTRGRFLDWVFGPYYWALGIDPSQRPRGDATAVVRQQVGQPCWQQTSVYGLDRLENSKW